jgi:hypothetical protein
VEGLLEQKLALNSVGAEVGSDARTMFRLDSAAGWTVTCLRTPASEPCSASSDLFSWAVCSASSWGTLLGHIHIIGRMRKILFDSNEWENILSSLCNLRCTNVQGLTTFLLRCELLQRRPLAMSIFWVVAIANLGVVALQ